MLPARRNVAKGAGQPEWLPLAKPGAVWASEKIMTLTDNNPLNKIGNQFIQINYGY